MRALTLSVALLLALSPVAVAHRFNHEDRHEVCQIYSGPHGHFVGDGHTHTHNVTSTLPDHDPCKQVRMKYPDWEDKAPLSEIKPPTKELQPLDLLFSDGDPTNTEVYIGGEAYQFPVPEGTFRVQSNLAVTSDLQAAGMGFPGSGTHDDPYIVEGYLIKGNMVFKDTSKCFVVRDNVVVSRAAVAPLVKDPVHIIHLPDLVPHWQQVHDTAQALRDQWQQLKAEKDALLGQWNGQKSTWDAQKAQWDSQMAGWQAQWDQFASDYVGTVKSTEQMAADFEAYASQYVPGIQEPAKPQAAYLDYANDRFLDRDAAIPAFESYQQSVQDWVAANPPPQDPPASWPGSASGWQVERGNYQTYQDDIAANIQYYWDTLMAGAPDEAAYGQFLADRDAFMVDYNAFLSGYNAFVADYNAFLSDYNGVMASTKKDLDDAAAFFAKEAQWAYEYTGDLGHALYNTADELLQWVLKTLFGILNPDDPNNVAQNTGQLVLDWNGQCVHAYNNVVNDLRVNQNNDRTGYATGGIVEDNRFYTIGQIRHYDGIFRQNEVGNRAFLKTLLDPSIVPAPASVRSVNNDGANQGWYLDNVFYGQVDLDFHGHHHSAGFFAPTSHYHGSNVKIVEMYDAKTGQCTTHWSDVDMSKHNGPDADHPQDSGIQVLGRQVTPGEDRSGECLDHMDHSKRWTSVLFDHNILIDPNGVGLRFEDRDHRQDDERANSENVEELKAPHFHQKWVQMEDNAIVGKIFIDVLNAAGTNLWSDDWSEVKSPSGPSRTVEALSHPGATIVNSHPYRNDAWLDIDRNSVFQTQPTGVLVSDADDMTLFQLQGNHAYGLPSGFQPGMTGTQFLQWLQDSRARSADAVYGDIQGWGGRDRGVQAFAQLSYLRDGFDVEHCGNTARGLDKGLVATDRVYDDGRSVIHACGSNDWGTADPAVDIRYTPAPAGQVRCTEQMRQYAADTDDFYVSELAFDELDSLVAAQTCQSVPLPGSPTAPPVPGVPSAPEVPSPGAQPMPGQSPPVTLPDVDLSAPAGSP
jgi:hypothetical protein